MTIDMMALHARFDAKEPGDDLVVPPEDVAEILDYIRMAAGALKAARDIFPTGPAHDDLVNMALGILWPNEWIPEPEGGISATTQPWTSRTLAELNRALDDEFA